jgi:hypothetical protein
MILRIAYGHSLHVSVYGEILSFGSARCIVSPSRVFLIALFISERFIQ